jgi:hypothetical protein
VKEQNDTKAEGKANGKGNGGNRNGAFHHDGKDERYEQDADVVVRSD